MKKILIFAVLFAAVFLTGFMYTGSKLVSQKQQGYNPVQNVSFEKSGQAQQKIDVDSTKSNIPDKNKQKAEPKPPVSNSMSTVKTGSTVNKPVSSNYFVKVDISDQRTYIYKGDKLLKAFICSTGIENASTRTPRGSYVINQSGTKKGEWFYSQKYKEGAKYWVGFIGGTYLFHSVPMDINKNIIKSEEAKLGTPASHGCVRLSVEDAYWFYINIPANTKLLIQD